ncbi:MAG: ABC transporter ATP-binding protein, partial [candidate division NC10 bacterium]|nr:ABC transporter ATP-binding protein [candidate division NC10 bacterium]
MQEILETRGLKKSFGEIHAVDGVSLRIPQRLLTSIIGPN